MKFTVSQHVPQEYGRIRATPWFIQAGKKFSLLVLFLLMSKNAFSFCVIDVVAVENK
jgi:hypothetical protein